MSAFAVVASSGGLETAAQAQERTAVRDGFAFDPAKPAKIILFRPSVKVGEQSTGGMFEPRAEWTAEARKNIEEALNARQKSLGHQVTYMLDVPGEKAQTVREYQALFGAVAQSVITYQFFAGNRLETKKRDNREGIFQWSLGPGVQDLPGADKADYILFILTEDHYGSTGRKIFQFLAAAAVGVGVTSGLHAGYAGLVDAKTGNLVWINADNAMGGNVREADGAQKRVTQLLEEFPLATNKSVIGQ
ncbi:MAG: hypothetical protein EBR34_04365 [Sphingomonadaceae bacterium]|nr:hypothetical protein [Sphingomonadaceae bacterium]